MTTSSSSIRRRSLIATTAVFCVFGITAAMPAAAAQRVTPIVRDHSPKPIVRDHTTKPKPIVRDHRTPPKSDAQVVAPRRWTSSH